MARDSESPYLQSYYYRSMQELKDGYKSITRKIGSVEKTFYLLRSNQNYDIEDTEKIVRAWKEEVRNATEKN
jgi:hypothetical protein